MSNRFNDELMYASRELARIHRDITHADVAALSASVPDRERGASLRAQAYIWLAAMLERVVREAMKCALRELSALSIPSSQIRMSLFSLLCNSEFTSVASKKRQAGWSSRVTIMGRLLETTPAFFSEDVIPLDGRTIRGEHFDTIWTVFGLPGASLPSPVHRMALKDLAEGRNEVAHGHSEPVVFGKKKATRDLLQLATRVDDVVSHLLSCLDDYILRGRYVR